MGSCNHLEVDDNLNMKLVDNKTYSVTGLVKCKNCGKTWHGDSWKVVASDAYEILKKIKDLLK